jgi:hypothetical protein
VCRIPFLTPVVPKSRPRLEANESIYRITSYEEADYSKRDLVAVIAANKKRNLAPRNRGRPGLGWCTVM